MKPNKTKSPDFTAYPSRTITLSDEVWNELKTAKLLSGNSWSNFIKELLKSKPHKSGENK